MMKKRFYAILSLALASGMLFTGCSSSSKGDSQGGPKAAMQDDLSGSGSDFVLQSENISAENSSLSESGEIFSGEAELTARFGYEGKSFTLHLYDNDTAAAIVRHVGSSDWNLPIYHYDDFDHWEVMQYYDIPSRYEIPSAPEEITAEKAGEVYYSEPNRIILFYHDAEVSAEYTPVGYFDATDEFIETVENNPVLEGWGNKIITISAGD